MDKKKTKDMCERRESKNKSERECKKGWWGDYGMKNEGGEKERSEREGEKGRFKLDDCLSIVYTKAYYR